MRKVHVADALAPFAINRTLCKHISAFQERIHRPSRIRMNGDLRTHVFAEDTRIAINMDELRIATNERSLLVP